MNDLNDMHDLQEESSHSPRDAYVLGLKCCLLVAVLTNSACADTNASRRCGGRLGQLRSSEAFVGRGSSLADKSDAEGRAFDAAIQDLGRQVAQLADDASVTAADLPRSAVQREERCEDGREVIVRASLDRAKYAKILSDRREQLSCLLEQLSTEIQQERSKRPIHAMKLMNQSEQFLSELERILSISHVVGDKGTARAPFDRARLHHQVRELVDQTPIALQVRADTFSEPLRAAASSYLSLMGFRIDNQRAGISSIELAILRQPSQDTGHRLHLVTASLEVRIREPQSSAGPEDVVVVSESRVAAGADPQLAADNAVRNLLRQNVANTLQKAFAGVMPTVDCAQGTTLSAAAPTAPNDPEPRRLLSDGSTLFLSGGGAGLGRGVWLYSLSPYPAPGSREHKRIGLLTIVNPDRPLTVSWVCRPRDFSLPKSGIPVEFVPGNASVKVGDCFGSYQPVNDDKCSKEDVIDLRLTIGQGDGLEPNSTYEVLGEPIVEDRYVTGFKHLGYCTVSPNGMSSLSSICRLDRRASSTQGFDAKRCLRGGFVMLHRP